MALAGTLHLAKGRLLHSHRRGTTLGHIDLGLQSPSQASKLISGADHTPRADALNRWPSRRWRLRLARVAQRRRVRRPGTTTRASRTSCPSTLSRSPLRASRSLHRCPPAPAGFGLSPRLSCLARLAFLVRHIPERFNDTKTFTVVGLSHQHAGTREGIVQATSIVLGFIGNISPNTEHCRNHFLPSDGAFVIGYKVGWRPPKGRR